MDVFIGRPLNRQSSRFLVPQLSDSSHRDVGGMDSRGHIRLVAEMQETSSAPLP